ncbi:hypothetical protein, partial [Streptococcus pneumoniae]
TYTGAAYASTQDLPQKGLPQEGQVVLGEATFSTTGNKMTINQKKPTTQIDWKSFDIGKNKEVEFIQPNS